MLHFNQPDVRWSRSSNSSKRGLCQETPPGEPGSGDLGPGDGDRLLLHIRGKQLHEDGEMVFLFFTEWGIWTCCTVEVTSPEFHLLGQ